MSEVFISYGHDPYKHLILKIKKSLEESGFKVLMDTEGLLSEGSDWRRRLEEAIEKPNIKFVYCITPHSVRRDEGYCLNEISYASMHSKEIIPIMIDDSGDAPLIEVCRLQWLDMLGVSNGKDLIDSKKFQSSINSLISVLSDDQRLGTNETVYSSLCKVLDPSDFDIDIGEYIDGFIGRDWIFSNLKGWMNKKDSSKILWISAEAGFGKSALSAKMTHKLSNVAGIFFCKYTRENKQEVVSELIKTFTYHLSTRIPDFRDLLNDMGVKKTEVDHKYLKRING